MPMIFPLRTVRDNIPHAESGEGYRETHDGHATEATRTIFTPYLQSGNYIRAVMPRVSLGVAIGTVTRHPGGSYLGGDNIWYKGRINISPVLGPRPVYDLEGDYFVLQRRSLHRLDPEPHPWMPWLHVVKAEMTGLGAAKMDPLTGRIYFREGLGHAGAGDTDGIARIVVTYRKLPYVVGVPDSVTNTFDGYQRDRFMAVDATRLGYELPRYVSRQFKPGSETYTIPAQQMQEFRGGPHSIIPEAMSKIVAKSHIVYTWHMVPQVPLTAGLLLGHVNDFPFDVNGLRELLGSYDRRGSDMQYLYPEIGDPYPMCDGVTVRDIKYHMLFRRPGNNYVFRPGILARNKSLAELNTRYAGWTLAIKKQEDAWRGRASIGLRNPLFPLAPGEVNHPYANLNSLFALHYESPDYDPGDGLRAGDPSTPSFITFPT